MERFNNLVRLYADVKTIVSAICVQKGGIDVDNYPGRSFPADLLEMIVAYGEKIGADVAALRGELEAQKGNLTPTNRPIYEMTLEEFEKLIAKS